MNRRSIQANRGRAIVTAAIVGALGAIARPAEAAPAGETPPETRSTSSWHLDIAVGTVIPMDVGGRITIGGPHRIQLSLGAGTIPDGYVDLITSTGETLDFLDESQAKLIEEGLYRATTLRAALGWTPWEEWGFYFDVGYAFQGFGGSTTVGDVIVAATGVDLPVVDLIGFDVELDLHVLTADVGYKWFVTDNLFLQGALGWESTLGASSRIAQDFGIRDIDIVDDFVSEAEEELNEIARDDIHHPTLTLLLGARGF